MNEDDDYGTAATRALLYGEYVALVAAGEPYIVPKVRSPTGVVIYAPRSVLRQMATGSVRVVATPSDLNASNPEEVFRSRALTILRSRYGFRDDEIEFVREHDPLFAESLHEAHVKAANSFDKRLFRQPRESVELTIEFTRPGTRSSRLKEVEA